MYTSVYRGVNRILVRGAQKKNLRCVIKNLIFLSVLNHLVEKEKATFTEAGLLLYSCINIMSLKECHKSRDKYLKKRREGNRYLSLRQTQVFVSDMKLSFRLYEMSNSHQPHKKNGK